MGKMRSRGKVLNRGYVAKHSLGSTFHVLLGAVVRSLKEADAGASGEHFVIIDLN